MRARAFIRVAVAVAISAGLGCQLSEPSRGEMAVVVRISPNFEPVENVDPDLEAYIVESPNALVRVGGDEKMAWPHGVTIPADPCQCYSQDCLSGWADEHIGCNVCISLICDGSPGPHVCHYCVQQSPH